MHRRRRRCSRRRRRIRSFSRKFWKARLSPGPGSAGGPRPRCAGLTRAASTHPRRGRVALRLPKGTPWRRSGAEGALHAESTWTRRGTPAGLVTSPAVSAIPPLVGRARRLATAAGPAGPRLEQAYLQAETIAAGCSLSTEWPLHRRRSTAKVVLEVRPAQVAGAGLENSRAVAHRAGRVAALSGSLGSRGAKTWRPRRGRGPLKI